MVAPSTHRAQRSATPLNAPSMLRRQRGVCGPIQKIPKLRHRRPRGCREDVLGDSTMPTTSSRSRLPFRSREQRRPRLSVRACRRRSGSPAPGSTPAHRSRLPAIRSAGHRWQAMLGQRDDAATVGSTTPGKSPARLAQRRRDLGHAGNLQQARRDARRHAACRSEHLCKARALVVLGLQNALSACRSRATH